MPLFPVALILPLACIYFAVFHTQTSFNDYAYLGTDTWVYQSMAVNTARGHGLNRFGGAEPFEDYQFGTLEWNREANGMDEATFTDRHDRFMVDGRDGKGALTTDRLPMYPLFMGLIYALFGVHPMLVKNAQLLLLCLVGAGLPLLGMLWWKRKGLVAGLIAGAPFVALTIRFANEILSETLTIFVLFLCVLAAAFYQQRPSAGRSILMGAALGLCLITKLSLVLLPFIFLFFLFLYHRAQHRPYKRDMLLMVITCVAMVLPWSLYISAQAGEPIVFSTESHNDGLFDAHNEFTVRDGYWHPEWETNPESIYRTDGLEDRTDFERIVRFYLASPDRIVRLPLSKLIAAFTTMPTVVLLLILLLSEGLLGSYLRDTSVRLSALIAGTGAWWLLTVDDRLHQFLQPLVNTNAVWLLLVGLIILCALLIRRFFSTSILHFPLMATAVITNFIVITILVMADPAVYLSRHIKTAEFLFVLLLSKTLIDWIIPLLPARFRLLHD